MKGIIRDAVTIAVKELKQLSRDPVSLALTLLFPVLLITMFINIAEAFGAPSYNIPMVVADLDRSAGSKMLVDKLTGSQIVKVIEFAQTEERGFSSIGFGAASGAVIIPKGFGDALAEGRPASIVLVTDNSKFTSSALIRSEVSRHTQEVAAQASDKFASGSMSIELVQRPVSGRPPSGDAILPGMLGIITILGAFDDILNTVSRERERGTFPRLLLTPTWFLSIYLGKILATLVLTVLRTSLALTIFTLAGLVVRGNIVLIFVTTSLIAAFTLSLGLVLSSRIRSSSTLTVMEIAITFPLFQLAGATQSRQILAEGGRAISSSLPWTYGNEALIKVVYLGLGVDAIASDLMVLLLSSMLLLPIALLLSKRTI